MGPFQSYKVLELAEGVAGEYCGKLLGDFGAEVIKIEKPGVGSPTRRLGPFGPTVEGVEASGLFAYLNTNKSSITLDVESEAGKATLKTLLAHVDVVIDDHAPGWLKSVGLDLEETPNLYPRLVLCSITPFGQEPSEERAHSEDINVFHASGWGYHTPTGADPATPPLSGPGRFLPSYEAALDAALCVASSLYEREESGLGQVIDISKQAVLASRVDYVLDQMVAGHMDVSTSRAAFDLFGPAGIFATRDGYIYIWMSQPVHWQALGQMMGHPEWMKDFPERWLEKECTPERVALVREKLTDWFKTQDKHAVSDEAQKLGLIMAAVQDVEGVMASPQYAFRGFFKEVTHPVLGKMTLPGAPYRMSATPAEIKTPAPSLGQQTQETLAALGAGNAGDE